MIVVADAGPINYLVLIGSEAVLPALYKTVIVPEAVVEELTAARAPAAVRDWFRSQPEWLEVRPAPATPKLEKKLGYGEAAAMRLALGLGAQQLLCDDRRARAFAERNSMKVVGTLGILLTSRRGSQVRCWRCIQEVVRNKLSHEPVGQPTDVATDRNQ